MEKILIRFPTVGLEIFKQLDNQNLTNCKKVSRSWNYLLSQNKLMWIRMIKKYQENHLEFKDDWKTVMARVPLETVKQLGIAVEKFYTLDLTNLKFQHSPLHVLADQGLHSHFEFLFVRTEKINPKRSDGISPYYFAAEKGHFEICKLIIENVDDKNPANSYGFTPLWVAA